MSESELSRLAWRIFLHQQLSMLTALVPVVYMVALIMGLEGDVALRVSLINSLTIVPVWGVTVPIIMIRRATRRALVPRAEDRPGDRLKRILELPRRIEVIVFFCYLGASLCYTSWPTYLYRLSPWVIPQVIVSFMSLVLIVFIRQSVGIQRVLQPYALEEFHRYPEVRPQGQGFLWPQQRWYLPYCFALFVFFTLAITGNILAKKAEVGFNALFHELHEREESTSAQTVKTVDFVRREVNDIMSSMVLPVVSMGAFIILTAAWSAWELARRQREGMDAVRQSIESIASGRPALPAWTSTDEVGDLSGATAMAFEQLRELSLSLTESAQLLGQAAEQINQSHRAQTEALSVQAASLQETQVTAQEIKQTSMVAAQKAESVLEKAERADELGRSGEHAIEQSLGGLRDIQSQVLEMAQNIRSLDERAKQIALITTTMKDLADQSNLLALNAAMEAMRAGEQGRGFSVVAREIRNLADQSIRSTHVVRKILQDLSNAIRTTADMTEHNAERVQSSVSQVRTFGDNMRQLSSIVRDNASTGRQISAAVSQQNAGINQIFQAVNELTRMMDQTMSSLAASDSAASQVRAVASRVAGLVERYGWQSRMARHAPAQEDLGKQVPKPGSALPGRTPRGSGAAGLRPLVRPGAPSLRPGASTVLPGSSASSGKPPARPPPSRFIRRGDR